MALNFLRFLRRDKNKDHLNLAVRRSHFIPRGRQAWLKVLANPSQQVGLCRSYFYERIKLHRLTRSNRPSRGFIPSTSFHLLRNMDRPGDYALVADAYPPSLKHEAGYVRCSQLVIPSPARCLIVVHAFYEVEARKIFERLRAYPDYDIILTTSVDAIADLFLASFDPARAACLRVPNVGRDIFPFLAMLRFAQVEKYAYFIKIHTKRSVHLHNGDHWLERNLNVLLPGPVSSAAVMGQVDADLPSIFGVELLPIQDHYRNNRRWLSYLLGHSPWNSNACFVPGSMFLGTGAFMREVRTLGLLRYRMESESGQLDGCLFHAIERLLGAIAQEGGGTCSVVPRVLLTDRAAAPAQKVKQLVR